MGTYAGGESPNSNHGVDWRDRMELLLDRSRQPSDQRENELYPVSKELKEYRQALDNSEAFSWFVTVFKTYMTMQGVTASGMGTIRNTVMRKLASSVHVSPQERPPTYNLNITLDWGPVEFFQEQAYEGSPADVIGRIITVTGNSNIARAVSCQEYMVQTWPETGLRTLNSVGLAIAARQFLDYQECKFPAIE
jgi:hypothetical protein